MTEYNPGGDMTDGITRAHVETPEEMAANPIPDLDDERDHAETEPGQDAYVPVDPAKEPVTLSSYTTQHAKVLRFEISVGADDDEHTIEHFEQAVRNTLAFARDHASAVFKSGRQELRWHNLTTTGAYYIIDGKVCMPVDYDANSKNRKPGTQPPAWAGGTRGGGGSHIETLAADEPTPVTDPSNKQQTVAELAGGMVDKLKGGSS